MSLIDIRHAITQVHHDEWARLVASLTKRFGDLDIAEDAALVAEGHRLVRKRLAARMVPGRYQILAAINAVHTSARQVRDTDWSQVVALYDQLLRLDPSPIVALNQAVAVAELEGPEVAPAAVDPLAENLAVYHAYHATRADLLRRLGRSQE